MFYWSSVFVYQRKKFLIEWLEMRTKSCNKKGFTLVELMVTLVVLMILISMGVGSYGRLFAKQKLVHRTERIYHFLRLATSESIKHNKKIYVHFCQLDSTGVWKMAMAEQSNCDCFADNSCLINGLQVEQDLADGKTLFISPSDIKFVGNKASFSPMRFSVNSGSITLTDISGNKLKVIQSTMRLRICAPGKAHSGYKKC